MKYPVLLIFLILGLIMITGCVNQISSGNPDNNTNLQDLIYQSGKTENPHIIPPETKTIKDMKGRIVQIPAEPSRVAIFSGPLAQIPYILGAEDSIIATTPAVQKSPLLRQIDPRLSSLPTPRGVTGEIDFETLSLLNPDMVIAPPLDGQLVVKRTSLPVVMVANSPGDSMTQIKEQMKFLGDVFNKTDQADAYCSYLDKMNAYLLQRSSEIPQSARKKVFCGYDASHLMTYGNDTFLQERITLAGGINVAGSLGSSSCDSSSCVPDKVTPPQSEVTLEQVIAWNPDVIIIDTGSPAELYRDSRWASVKAVRDHQVFVQPFGIFKWSRQNAESALFYPLWLAKTLYPDQFADYILEKSIRDFYRDFFHYPLSDYQMGEIMSGSYSQYSEVDQNSANIIKGITSGVTS